MDKYVEAEKRLAELLGWTHHAEENRVGPRWRSPSADWLTRRPRWTRDNATAFALMVEHGIRVSPASDFVTAKHDIDGDFLVVEYSDHPDRETAVRYAVVQAVIARLEANNG